MSSVSTSGWIRKFAGSAFSLVALAASTATWAQQQNARTADSELSEVLVRGTRLIDVGPMPGLAITRDQIPANVQSATQEQLQNSGALNIADYMNTQMQGVTINDYAGNPFQMDVNYRGFSASPQIGSPQGLSVFFDGARINEPFGDVVNWDLIPVNAIERFDLFPGSNPLFGLNTLGGAISVRSRSGFTSPEAEFSVLGGSWGREQAQASIGGNNGKLAGFVAANAFYEKGWRDDSPSRVDQFYGRGDLAVENGMITASVLAADNRLIGNGLIPLSLYRERAESVFTSPDRTGNRLLQASLAGAFDVSTVQNITLRVYSRDSRRIAHSGDIYEGFDDFSGINGLDVLIDRSLPIGQQIIARNGAKQFGLVGGNVGGTGVVDGTPIGLLTDTNLQQRTIGGAVQSSWNFERHKFMVGASVDRSRATYLMEQQLGLITPEHAVYADPDDIDPIYYAASHEVPGNDFTGMQATSSAYLSETFSALPNLFITADARYNHTSTDSRLYGRASAAQRALHELRTSNAGVDALVNAQVLTAEQFHYESFNPSLGVNWLPLRDLNLFANLSRGARVPSVVELGCAFDSTPVTLTNGAMDFGTVPRSLTGPGCSLPTTLSGDPYLPQIRSTSGEVGARGALGKALNWNASLFRADLKNDIYFVGVGDGKSFFDTIGKTRRQGLEAGFNANVGRMQFSVDYTFTDATFQSTLYTLSPHNSSADFDQNSQAVTNHPDLGEVLTLPSPTAAANGGRGTYHMIRIDPGARLPGIARNAVNASVSLHATSALQVGLSAVLRSGSFVRGNENNQHQPGGTDQEIGIYYCDPNGGCNQGFTQQYVRPGRLFTDSGKVSGYAIVNFDASYQIESHLRAALKVTNLLDKSYATAGRLGVNPFSPSVNGAIGASGWNYNSAEWQNSTYVGPGAPRGFWLSLTWERDPR
ncbi:MAG: TonB-dependent receptor [Pseudomonadota bacterium]